MSEIGERIRQMRHEKGMSQRQLADKIGVSQNAIHSWEKRTENHRLSTVKKVAEALGVDYEILTKEEPKPEELNQDTDSIEKLLLVIINELKDIKQILKETQ